eukprot:TRINITY_DN14295_c0_g1_i1.p1 TRINITY_DN14295_c0_g1~~TRINITY_DN14295_c0_g1_i1.p1  ORF type:complete len:379 (+),score=30.10 TRINITY_DN14295_c0_g1_i1:58-1137(+)
MSLPTTTFRSSHPTTAPAILPTWPTYGPTLPPLVNKFVHGPVVIALCVLLGLLTAALMLQVFRVWRYKYQKWSCFNLCLTSSLVWGILRTTLLISYAIRHHVANNLSAVGYLLLFVLPACLQFLTFSAVVLHFANVSLKDLSSKDLPHRIRLHRFVFVGANTGFIATNVICALASNEHVNASTDDYTNVNTRVVISELFMLINCLALSAATIKMRRLIQSQRLVEGQGITGQSMACFSWIIVPLFISRAIYNFVAISNTNLSIWGYRWTFLSDHSDRHADDGYSFVAFVVCLVIWEWLPVLIVTCFFWVRSPSIFDSSAYEPLLRPQVVSFEHDPDESSDEEDGFSINVVGYDRDNHIA